MVRPRTLQEKYRSLVAGPGQVLQSPDRHEQACALSMLHNPRDVKIMIEKAESSSHLGVLGFGRPIVHQDVVGAGHVVPFEKYEPARDITKSLRVNPIDHVHSSRRTEL